MNPIKWSVYSGYSRSELKAHISLEYNYILVINKIHKYKLLLDVGFFFKHFPQLKNICPPSGMNMILQGEDYTE